MQMLLNLAFTDARVAVVNVIVIAILLFGLIDGYLKGFLEYTVRFVGTVAAVIIAYLIKNPLSVFMYKHLPFFQIGGMFKGVSVINILIYEVIAFLLIFIILMIIIKVIFDITDVINKIITVVSFIGLPNKILGALMGLLENIIILFFLACTFRVTMSFKGIDVNPTLADDIMEVPLLKDTFGDSFKALDEIGDIAKNYESINAREEYNYESLKILLKYDIVTMDNAKYLVDNGKIKIPSDKDFDKIMDKEDVKEYNTTNKDDVNKLEEENA